MKNKILQYRHLDTNSNIMQRGFGEFCENYQEVTVKRQVGNNHTSSLYMSPNVKRRRIPIRKITALPVIISIILLIQIKILIGGTGESGVTPLMLNSYSARAMALADAFTGITEDVTCISFNPAALSTLEKAEINLMYMNFPAGMHFNNIAFGLPLTKKGLKHTVGLNFISFLLPEFEQYDSFGNTVGEKLSALDMVITAGYGINIEKIYTGINIKFISSQLVSDTKSGFAFDFGLLYKLTIGKLKDNLSIGLAMQNIGTGIKYGTEETKLPITIKIGAGYKIFENAQHNILTAIDFNLLNESKAITSIGIEYTFIKRIVLRAGYKLRNKEFNIISFGTGGKFNIGKFNTSVDYSLTLLGDIGLIHSVSLGIKF